MNIHTKHPVPLVAAACALLVACAAPSSGGGAPAAGRGWIAVSANDGKSVLDNGVTKVLNPPLPDTVSVIDLRGGTPRVVAEVQAPTIVVGPPFAVAVAPDESYALVTSGKKAVNDALVSDNVLSVIDLQSSPPRVVQTVAVGAGAAGVS